MTDTLTQSGQLQQHVITLVELADVQTQPISDSISVFQSLIDTAAPIMAANTERGDNVAYVQEGPGLPRPVSGTLTAYQAYGAPLGLVVDNDTHEVSIATLLGDHNQVVAATVSIEQYVTDSLRSYWGKSVTAPGHVAFARAIAKQCAIQLNGNRRD